MSDISKLPKWAQEHILKLQRERDAAIGLLNKWCDNQTVAPISVKEYPCTGEQTGPVQKVRYVQGHQVGFNWAGIDARVSLTQKDDGQRPFGIEITYEATDITTYLGIGIIPGGHGKVTLVHKENM